MYSAQRLGRMRLVGRRIPRVVAVMNLYSGASSVIGVVFLLSTFL